MRLDCLFTKTFIYYVKIRKSMISSILTWTFFLKAWMSAGFTEFFESKYKGFWVEDTYISGPRSAIFY